MSKIPKNLTPEISEKYTVENNTFLATPKDNPKDLVQLEIGDSKTPEKMLPQQKIMRWDNECNVSIRLKDFDNFTVETEGEKIKLVKPEKEVHFYQIAEGEGASEFEVLLKSDPRPTKKGDYTLEFTLEDKDVDYFYQPALTPEEIEQGASRPENVEGSYAIYAKTPKTNYVGGKEYKTGKVGHIYRPKHVDAVGLESWGTLDINAEAKLLKVTIPGEFLDKAVYPVRHAAGLTFGWSGQASHSAGKGANVIFASSDTASPASNGTLNSVTNNFNTASGNVKFAIYDGTTLVDYTAGIAAAAGVITDNVVLGSSVSSGTGYKLAMKFSAANNTLHYDTSAAALINYAIDTYANNFPNPISWGSTGAKDRYAIYATYTAAASGPANLKSYNTNLKANIKSINTNLIANVKSLNTNV